MDSTTITDRLCAAFAVAEQGGLKQADLARQLGLSRATIGDWLKGRTANIKPDNLFAVADALGVEARWLATGRGPRERIAITRDQQSLMKAYRALNDAERSAVKVLVQQIAESRADYSA